MPCENFLAALEQLNERFATGPCVLATTHGSVGEISVAVNTSVAQHFLFDGNGTLEEFGMALGKADPLGFTLVEAEVAPRASPPLVVFGKADASIFEDAENVVVRHAIFDKRKASLDVGLGRNVAFAVGLIGANGDIRDDRLIADPFLNRLDLHVPGTPPHLRRRQRTSEHLKPVFKATRGIEPSYRLAKYDLKPGQVLVSLWQLGPSVAEEVLHIRNLAAHVHSESAGILAP